MRSGSRQSSLIHIIELITHLRSEVSTFPDIQYWRLGSDEGQIKYTFSERDDWGYGRKRRGPNLLHVSER